MMAVTAEKRLAHEVVIAKIQSLIVLVLAAAKRRAEIGVERHLSDLPNAIGIAAEVTTYVFGVDLLTHTLAEAKLAQAHAEAGAKELRRECDRVTDDHHVNAYYASHRAHLRNCLLSCAEVLEGGCPPAW